MPETKAVIIVPINPYARCGPLFAAIDAEMTAHPNPEWDALRSSLTDIGIVPEPVDPTKETLAGIGNGEIHEARIDETVPRLCWSKAPEAVEAKLATWPSGTPEEQQAIDEARSRFYTAADTFMTMWGSLPPPGE